MQHTNHFYSTFRFDFFSSEMLLAVHLLPTIYMSLMYTIQRPTYRKRKHKKNQLSLLFKTDIWIFIIVSECALLTAILLGFFFSWSVCFFRFITKTLYPRNKRLYHTHTYIIHERCLTENQFTRGAIFCCFFLSPFLQLIYFK